MPTTYDPRRKRTTGAGVYSGYGKNFKPTGKSFGTSQESAALKALQFLVGDGGSERQIKGPDGRTYTVKMEEGGVSGVAGAIGSMVAKNVAAATAKNLAKSSARGMGKTDRAVGADAAKAASRRTASESSTIRKGNEAAKTPEMAKKLEQQAAASNASKSVNAAERSPVVPRTGTSTGAISKGITQKRMAEFSADKGGRIANAGKSKRTPAQARRAQADLEDSLKRGAQARAEGRKPGEDIPSATGRGIYDPVPAPRSTPRQIGRAHV